MINQFVVMSRTPFYRTSNKLEHHLSNIEQTRRCSSIGYLFLASNDRTSNFEPNRAFTRFSKLLIEQYRTSVFRTLNELERVHLMVIELEHPIFGFERLDIELRT